MCVLVDDVEAEREAYNATVDDLCTADTEDYYARYPEELES